MKNSFSLLLTVCIAAAAFSQKDMAFQASIDHKNGDVLFIKANKKVIQEIKIDGKGIFKATFPVEAGMYQLYDGKEYASLFLKNGYDLKMTMDAASFDETIRFEGKGAKENNYLSDETRFDEAYNYETLLALDPTGFKKANEIKQNDAISKLEKAGCDPLFVELYKKVIASNAIGMQQYYEQVLANKKLNNSKAPSFDYENAAGGKTSLESLKGKYVYIDVWATWCGPCRAEIPFLKELSKNNQGKNIAFVSISADVAKDHDKWKTFVKEKALDGIQLYADKNFESDFIKAFSINSIPRFILIDPSGNVLDADALRPSNPLLQKKIDELLK